VPRPRIRLLSAIAVAGAALLALAIAPAGGLAKRGHVPRALLVGSWHGHKGQFKTIQAAVNAARSGDWVLVGPGDYHERADFKSSGRPSADDAGGGVYITKPGLHLRGMNRNRVVVDGTKRSSKKCSSAASDQTVGPLHKGERLGRNGVEVWKANGVYVENLTVCNFLGSGAGNEIWWNGGDGSGKVGLGSYWGNYITGTTTYIGKQDSKIAQYAIFVSNSRGPGVIDHSYGSNMADSNYYVGACPDCSATINHAHSENGALGFSGTNAGGHLVLKNSEWDKNRAGIVPNSLNNDDAPPPQDGRCPHSTTKSCTVIENNHIHDNNNPNTPGAGVAASGPVGVGIELVGASYNTVRSNKIDHNGAWGIVIHEYPDTETPPASGISHCQGGTQLPGGVCNFPAIGNIVHDNRFSANGGFGQPTNGDIGDEPAAANPHNCFFGNTDPAGLSSDPPNIQTVDGPPCTGPGPGDEPGLGAALICASSLNPTGSCSGYPGYTGVKLLPLKRQPTMPNPCAGVPANAWCPKHK